MSVLTNARLVTPNGILSRGWMHLEASRIVTLGTDSPPPDARPARDLGGSWIMPGFVDLHVHGGGGASMTGGSQEQILRAVEFHRGHGTTRTLISLVTAPLETMLAGAAAVADLVEAHAPGIAGCHLEGPFLSPVRRGAQDPRSLLPPDPEILERLLAAGRGTVRMVTVAPELPGACELIRRVVAARSVAAIGHTDASYEEVLAGVEAGATVATHLFNGMRPLHHRDPGPVAAALERPEVICELINDGVHLDPAVIRLVVASVGPERVAFITDAIAATGMADGDHYLGPLRVRVVSGQAKLMEGGNIAGSTLTMDRAFRRAVLEVGLSIEVAVEATSSTPARILSPAALRGCLEAGQQADLAVLDNDLNMLAVMTAGDWVGPAPGRLL